MKPLPNELEAFFSGEASPQQVQALEDWINADPDNARAFIAQAHFRELIGQTIRHRNLTQQPPGHLLHELAELEAAASAPTIEWVSQSRSTGLPHWQLWAGLAALVMFAAVLGLTLYVVQGPGVSDPYRNTTAQHPPTNPAPGPKDTPTRRPVATLTVEHNAAWDRRPGEELHAGQRFTLTKGFAEITTGRGAVAIIEAPATIELLQNDNAICLHTGKLIGICETPSSKGLLVRTPHMDVTDLGTRFGVASGSMSGTFVTVFDGQIEVASPDGLTPVRTLGRAESIAVDTARQETESHPFDTTTFSTPADMNPGIAMASGSVRFLFVTPDELTQNQYRSDSHVSVFEELRGDVLPGDVPVSFVSPGKYDRMLPDNIEGTRLEAGTATHSYVIRARPGTQDSTYRGELTFETPILGVMILAEDWHAFETLMPDRAISLDPMPSELLEGMDQEVLPDASVADWVRISEDRKTLSFYLYASAAKADLIRVFVEAPVTHEPLGL
ncbi:MAG: hypothetical protein AAGH88_07810 [Planctomycetota bacterium]